MNPYSETQLDRIFQSLSDPYRREILTKIAIKEMNISEIAAPFDISLAAVSKHLRVLEEAELIKKIKKGRQHKVLLNADKVKIAYEYLTFYQKFWEQSFDALEQYLMTHS